MVVEDAQAADEVQGYLASAQAKCLHKNIVAIMIWVVAEILLTSALSSGDGARHTLNLIALTQVSMSKSPVFLGLAATKN